MALIISECLALFKSSFELETFFNFFIYLSKRVSSDFFIIKISLVLTFLPNIKNRIKPMYGNIINTNVQEIILLEERFSLKII